MATGCAPLLYTITRQQYQFTRSWKDPDQSWNPELPALNQTYQPLGHVLVSLKNNILHNKFPLSIPDRHFISRQEQHNIAVPHSWSWTETVQDNAKYLHWSISKCGWPSLVLGITFIFFLSVNWYYFMILNGLPLLDQQWLAHWNACNLYFISESSFILSRCNDSHEQVIVHN